jgi:hypothetical protein
VVEQHNQTVVAMVRCLLKTKVSPGYFWDEAIAMVIHILNWSSTHAVTRKTLYEAWHWVPPTVHYMRMFNCITQVKIMHPVLKKKLDDRSWQTIFVGYEAGSKAYRCYDPTAQCVIISRDVVFDEAGKWHWEDNNTEPMVDSDLFTIEYTTELVHAPALAVAMPSPSPIPAAPPVGEDVAHAAANPKFDDEVLDTHHDGAPLCLHNVSDIVGDAPMAGPARRVLVAELNFTTTD